MPSGRSFPKVTTLPIRGSLDLKVTASIALGLRDRARKALLVQAPKDRCRTLKVGLRVSRE